MKKYITPYAEIVELVSLDVITLSAPDNLAEYDDTREAPGSWFD